MSDRCECHECTQARWLMDVRSQWMPIGKPLDYRRLRLGQVVPCEDPRNITQAEIDEAVASPKVAP